MNWLLTPDQFALVWERTDGDRIPYPLAVRLSARDTAERTAQLPALNAWCDRTLDADLEAALRVLAHPTLRIEVFGERDDSSHHSTALPGQRATAAPNSARGPRTAPGGRLEQSAIGESGHGAPEPLITPGAAFQRTDSTASGVSTGNPVVPGETGPVISTTQHDPAAHHGARIGDSSVRPVRILGAVAGGVAVVATQRVGADPDRGGDIRIFVDDVRNLSARIVSVLPENVPGTSPRLTAQTNRVGEDSRDMVTMPVAGPSTPSRIRKLLKRSRDGIGQMVVSIRRGDNEMRPFGVLCWIDVAGDGRYAVRTGADVDIVPVDAQRFTAQLRPMLTAAERTLAAADRW